MAKITIFGLAGTGKTSASKLISEKLGYKFQSSGNMFRAMAEEIKMTLFELEELSKTDDKYDLDLDKKVALYGKTHDNFVFESRLAWHFIPDSFKIYFDCDFDERTKRVSERENKSLDQVRKETILREEAIVMRYKKYYGIENILDKSNFDLVVDTYKNNLKEVVDLVVKVVKGL